jgi:hypothetical protein
MGILPEKKNERAAYWFITEGKPSRQDPSEFDPEAERGSLKEYRISEIGRYLLNPGPIEIRKRLAGCEAYPVKKGVKRLFDRLSRHAPKAESGRAKRRDTEVLLCGFKLTVPDLQDPELESHLKRIADELRAFDPFSRKLARLDPRRYAHIVGICEDFSGYSYLKLQGSAEEKLRYLNSYVGREVRVTLHRANISEGLFELRGFTPATFNPNNSFRLFTYNREGQPAACVLSPLGNLDFRVASLQNVKYLCLLEQTLLANPDLQRAFDACFRGRFRPVRLFFNKQLEVDYSKANFPTVYRDLFRSVEVNPAHRNLVKPILNMLQCAVSISYLPPIDAGEEKLYTQISILHDLRALEPLRKSLPAVYDAFNRIAFNSEAGRFYLLDSITGATHAE